MLTKQELTEDIQNEIGEASIASIELTTHLADAESCVLLTDTIHLPNHQAYVRTIDAEDGSTVAFCVSNPEVEHQSEYDGEMSIGEQLHLIMAAAPDLLESLAEMTEMFERHINGLFGPDDAAARYDRARAALAKAVGRES